VDVEYEDIIDEVPVYAIWDGEIVYSNWVSGYGGVTILKFNWQDQDYLALYGHINPDQLPSVGEKVSHGQKLDILGQEYSSQTDDERKHLHFGIIKGTQINLKGYVQEESQLSAWIDPLDLYK
jgi:septal ring factor EnvC (AmiA/AmiB activator)